jgi:hypothetical protein
MDANRGINLFSFAFIRAIRGSFFYCTVTVVLTEAVLSSVLVAVTR